MKEITFVPLSSAPAAAPTWMCARCGAVVAVRDGHADWHRNLTAWDANVVGRCAEARYSGLDYPHRCTLPEGHDGGHVFR